MLGDIGSAVDALTNITSGALGSIPVIGGGLKAAFDEAQGAMRSALVTGFDYNDMMKRTSASYTLLTGDARKAADEIAALSRIATSSEFGKPAIFAAARQLQVMGLNAAEAEVAVRGIANAASALGGGES